MKDIFVCTCCKSVNVSKLAWVDPNENNSFIKYYDDNENSFCSDCGCSIAQLKEVKHKQRKSRKVNQK
jgi:hypothetical protein